jgi:hypothetical protein
VVAALLAASSQANANTVVYTTGTINHVANIDNTPYNGSISYSALKNGFAAYNGQSLTSGTMTLVVTGVGSGDVWLDFGDKSDSPGIKVDTHSLELPGPGSPANTYTFTLSAYDLTYIEDHNAIYFEAEADCTLDSYDLTVDDSPASTPDGSSTLILLGGVLTSLALLKRKMA